MTSRHATVTPISLWFLLCTLAATLLPSAAAAQAGPAEPDLAAAAEAVVREMVSRHGEEEGGRIRRGVDQARRYWRQEDGDAETFERFVLEEFLPRGETLDATFERFEASMERVDGYFTSMIRDLRRGQDLEIGPLLPLDRRLAAYDPSAHLSDDLFANKIAFVALLNFPLTTLQQRLTEGAEWTRRQWAEARLAQQFSSRVPADVSQEISEAGSAAGSYISSYNIYMHHVLTPDGRRLFPEGLRLISHWNLRDELKARYADPEGFEAQRLLQKVMEAIVLQEVPGAVIDNPLLDWTPATNEVAVSPVRDAEPPPGAVEAPDDSREPDERYRVWLRNFKATRLADPYFPDNPTLMDRRFNINREIPEKEVEALFEAVLTSPLRERVGRLIEERLGRPLEPFDIWYVGFRPRGKYEESELDAVTRERYPSPDAYAADMPRMLERLGFSPEKARFLAEHIVVEPSRGVGHAFGAGRRDDKAHLRTRVGEAGMDYKGYNIAVHEMGHNAEQVFSMTTIDHTLLQGVPNTAFTEAMAYVFQSRDLELLDLEGPEAGSGHMKTLDDFWATREIAAVSLVDMKSWRWLYEHPDATPAQFREAVVGISKEIWNRHFSPVFGSRDVVLLGIYSHMIMRRLYTPDYALGHLISFQIEEHFKTLAGPLGAEFERMCKLGAITPDAWMRQAVGGPISAEPLLEAAAGALEALGR